MLYIILIILLVIALLLAIELWCFSVIEIVYKNKILTLKVKTPFYKKVIKQDFNQNKDNKKNDDNKKINQGTGKKSLSSEKIEEIKKRIFNPDTGFDADELKNVLDEFAETYSYVLGIIKKLLGKLRHKIHINKTYIKLDYGTDNPAATGFVYGSAWNLLGIIYPVLTMYFSIDYPMLDITPDFYSKRFDIEAESIIKVRAAHIIRAGLSSLLVPTITYLKDKKKKGRENNVR